MESNDAAATSASVILPPPGGEDISVKQASGAFYQAVHTVRQVKIYPMTESELTSLNMFSTIATGASALATAAIGFGLSIWWDVATSGEQAVRTLGDPILKVLAIVVAVCVAVVFWAARKKGNELTRILNESRTT